MGTGCESVNRMSSENADIVVGRWKDGRIGTFRGIKKDQPFMEEQRSAPKRLLK